MFKYLLGIMLCIQVHSVFADSKDSSARTSRSWTEVKKSLGSYIAKYKNKKLTLSQKQELIQPVNKLITQALEVRILSAEKSDMIAMMVELVRVSQDVDLTNTHSEALLGDYKVHKNSYLSVIERISSKTERRRVADDFRDWESYDLSGT